MPPATLSIIVPCYNVSGYIDECLASITSQTYQQLEIILIDDGSTDDTCERCDSWAQRDNRIIVIHQQNQGLSAARNAGLDIASGDYILCVDSDDRIDSTLAAKCMGSLQEEAADMVFYGYNTIDSHGNFVKAMPIECTAGDQVMSLLLSNVIRSYSWQFICTKELYVNVRFPVSRKAEDLSTTYLLVDKAKEIIILPDCLYDYRRRDNSIIADTLNNSRQAIRYYQDELQAFHEIKTWASVHANPTYYSLTVNTMMKHLLLHYSQMVAAKNAAGESWVRDRLLTEACDVDRRSIRPAIAFQLLLLKTNVLHQYDATRASVKKHIKTLLH